MSAVYLDGEQMTAGHLVSTSMLNKVLLAHYNRGALSLITCFCEPGGGRIGVDGTEPDHLVEFNAFTDRHTD